MLNCLWSGSWDAILLGHGCTTILLAFGGHSYVVMDAYQRCSDAFPLSDSQMGHDGVKYMERVAINSEK